MDRSSREAFQTFAKLAPYLRPYWSWLLVGAGLALVVSSLDGLVAWMVKPALDGIFVRRDYMMLKLLPVAIFLTYLIKGTSRYAQAYLMAAVGERVMARVRRDLYAHIIQMPVAFFQDRRSADLMSRLTIDTGQLGRSSSQVLVLAFRQVATIAALLTVMLIQEWRLTLLALIAFPLVGLTGRAIGQKIYQIGKRVQARMADLNNVIQEALMGAKIVKAFGREAHEVTRFEEVNRRLLTLALKNARADELTEPLMEILGAIGLIAGLWYGGYQVIQGQTTPGTFFSFLAATIMLYGPVRRLSRISNVVHVTAAASERIFQILAIRPTVTEPAHATVLEEFHDRIEFDHVWFQYDPNGEMVLKDLSLTVKKGEVVAFVGLSGAGKSTLVDLIPRFHDVTHGAIRIDSVDLREASLASLRGQIGLVTQETFLFNETIYYNIAYGRPNATREDVERASQQAYAHDFIMALPEGYETPAGERGVRLSGGQRQRVAIARAFLKDAPLLILDEATSDLDAESEFMVQQALSNLMKGRTVLVIAHRLSTVRSADRIVVITGGRVAEAGRHEELLARDGLYRRLYSLQFNQDLSDPASP